MRKPINYILTALMVAGIILQCKLGNDEPMNFVGSLGYFAIWSILIEMDFGKSSS